MSDSVQEVFRFWQTELGYSKRKLVQSRRKHINARLEEGYTVEELQQVITNVKFDPWWRGQNSRNTPYDDIPNLFRNAVRVDQLLALAGVTGRSGAALHARPGQAAEQLDF